MMQNFINQIDTRPFNVLSIQDQKELGQIISQEVNGKHGYVLLNNLGYDTDDCTQREWVFTELASSLGIPEGHNVDGKIIWDVKPKVQTSSQITTFSEHQDEAPPHNDSVYSENIEDYFGLAVINPASDGGGRSQITSNVSIIQELKGTEYGYKVLETLRNESFPFAIPTVFIGKEGNTQKEVVIAPILEHEDCTRFRLDLILKGFEKAPQLWSEVKEKAVRTFYELAISGRHTKDFFMQKGDILFGHNRRILHARTPFFDSERHLLRIRMRAFESHVMSKISMSLLVSN
jgi:hypothetical protein